MIGRVLIGIVFRGRIVCFARVVVRRCRHSLTRRYRFGTGLAEGSQVTISRIAGKICRLRISRVTLGDLVLLLLAGTEYKE